MRRRSRRTARPASATGSIKDIADLLQVGVSQRGTVYGPMAEVVYNSLQYLSDEDVEGDGGLPEVAAAARRRAAADQPGAPGRARRDGAGRKIYATQCADCHGDEGKGYPPAYPPLAGNQSITMASPVNSIRMVLNGGYPPGTRKNPRPHGMPPFSHMLNDDEVAAVVTYIRVAWDNSGTPVPPPRPTTCASCSRSESAAMHAPTTTKQPTANAEVDEIVGRGPSGAFAVAGVATAIVVAIYFVLRLRLPAAGRRPVSRAPIAHGSEAVAIAAERRWAIIVIAIIACSWR